MNDYNKKPANPRDVGADTRNETGLLAHETHNRDKSLPAGEVQEINKRHIQQYDRFFRMEAGSSLDLLSYQDGVVELELFCPEFHYRRRPGAIGTQIRCWVREGLFASASSYVVHVYSTSAPFGDHQAIEPLTQPRPDVKIDEIRGSWPDLVRELRK